MRRRDDPRRLRSVGRSSYRTLCRSPRPLPAGRRPHHMNFQLGGSDVSVVISLEAPCPMSCDTLRGCSPRAEPPPTRCCVPARLSEQVHSPSFSGPRLRYRFLQHVMTRGHVCKLTILFVCEAVDPCPHSPLFFFRRGGRRAMPSDDFFRALREKRAAPFGAGSPVCW